MLLFTLSTLFTDYPKYKIYLGGRTRGPIEFNCSNSPSFQCDVLIRFDNDTENPRTQNVATGLTDPSELPAAILRGQLAAIFPDTPLQQILDSSPPDLEAVFNDLQEATFTSNVVCVNLAGPQLPTAQLIDLPGMSFC